jgi:hypothetical protein
VVGLFAPLAICVALVPFRSSLPNTDAALILVAAIVAVATLGSRAGGYVAALSSAVWFDFFLTKPYEHFSITSHPDIETTVLLIAIGVGVTELAVWGRRQQRRAGQQAGYLAGLHAATEAMSTGGSPTRLAHEVAEQLTQLLELAGCRFHFGSGLGDPRLEHDGSLTWNAEHWDVDRLGFPPGRETELLVTSGSGFHGRFLMTPSPGSQPDRTQRLVAVSLAAQVGAALGEYDSAVRS